jgi:putative Mn2+ efflux pump MntP
MEKIIRFLKANWHIIGIILILLIGLPMIFKTPPKRYHRRAVYKRYRQIKKARRKKRRAEKKASKKRRVGKKGFVRHIDGKVFRSQRRYMAYLRNKKRA